MHSCFVCYFQILLFQLQQEVQRLSFLSSWTFWGDRIKLSVLGNVKNEPVFRMTYSSEIMCLEVNSATVTYSLLILHEPRQLSALQMDHLGGLS